MVAAATAAAATTATTNTTFANHPDLYTTDLYNIAWLGVLFLLGCGPTWCLILKAEYKWRQYRGTPQRKYYHHRTTLDLWYLWSRRCVTLTAGFYFMTALSLTPPALFASSPTMSTFVAKDMLALKHVMHGG